MYPPKPTGQYYPTAPPVGAAPPPSMGIPLGATNPNNYQQYPAAFQTQTRGPVPWSTGLLDCTDDCGNCCMTCFCPCITFGRIAEIVDQGSTSCGASGALYGLLEYFTCCHWLYSCMYRSKLRAQYSLAESPCNDCFVHCCCEVCALCQEYRELKSRGFDITIGWNGNMERQARGAVFQPPMQGGMTR